MHAVQVAIESRPSLPLAVAVIGGAQQDLLLGQAGGAGALYQEYVARKDVQRMAAVPGRKCAVYEFPWGFVTEEYGVWNFYASAVWRAGTTNFLDRFEPAWKAIAEPALRAAMERERNRFYISFDDGIGIYGCLSLACVLDSKGERLAREWLASEFLPRLWPQIMQSVLDPEFDFRSEPTIYC